MCTFLAFHNTECLQSGNFQLSNCLQVHVFLPFLHTRALHTQRSKYNWPGYIDAKESGGIRLEEFFFFECKATKPSKRNQRKYKSSPKLEDS
jgi:hypothetical protein